MDHTARNLFFVQSFAHKCIAECEMTQRPPTRHNSSKTAPLVLAICKQVPPSHSKSLNLRRNANCVSLDTRERMPRSRQQSGKGSRPRPSLHSSAAFLLTDDGRKTQLA